MCEFNPEQCTVECPKYPMCAFFYSQKTLTDIQLQMNSLFSINLSSMETLQKLNEKILLNKKNTEDLFSAFYSYMNQNSNLGEQNEEIDQ